MRNSYFLKTESLEMVFVSEIEKVLIADFDKSGQLETSWDNE